MVLILICMFIKKNDIVSNNIIKLHYWEKNHTMKILKAMQYYA